MTIADGWSSSCDSVSSQVVLRLSGVHKRYGGVWALRGVDFDLRAGEVHALVGQNGAGKSTLIKIVSGAEVADGGHLTMSGLPLAGGKPQAAMAAGIATVYQEPHLFGELTVAENVFLGRELRSAGRVDWAAQRTHVRELLQQLGVDPRVGDVRVADLTVAEQQLVSIAKAFAHFAKVLILDEPSAILTDREIEVLFTVVRRLREAGVGIIYISHRLDELAHISDRITVLRDGQTVMTRPTAEVTVRQIAEAMVGHELAPTVVRRQDRRQDTVLSVAGLARSGRFEPLDVDVHAAEVVALYGLVGSGTAAVARALYGIDPADHGTVRVDGEPMRIESPRDAAVGGIALLPGNRKEQGLFTNKSIAFNVSSSNLRFMSRMGFWFDRARERKVATDFIARIPIKAPGPGASVQTLSGGNQQKVVLARQLVRVPRVLILEEPTQGVDIGAKDEIHRLIVELAERGTAVLVISTDLSEVLQMADRILVVRRGRVVREFGRGATQAAVLAVAAGDDDESPVDQKQPIEDEVSGKAGRSA